MISYSLALFSIVIWTRLILASNTPAISMVFFDVGHGDACLIQLPNGKTMLVDTGNRSPYSDQAKQVILPFLASQGIDKLDVVLITHPHLDHMGGLGTLLSSIPVHRLIGGLQTRDLYQFTEGDTPFAGSITQVFAGDTLLLDPSVRIRIFSPTAQLAAHPNPNESSVVFQLQYGSHRYLFLGDAEQQAEQALSENYTALLYSDIVKVAHHGSRTSSTPTLITRLSTPAFSSHEKYHPHTAVISVGNGIRYGLPDEEVIERWQTAAVNTHVTASAGALWIKSDGLKISQVAY